MKKFFILIMAMAGVMSCAKNEVADHNERSEIKFDVSFPGQTKATATGFENGDKISLYAVEYNGATEMPLQVGGNYINNACLTYNGTDWAPVASQLYWSDKNCDFYAFYPYVSSITSLEKHPFSVALDQTGDGYEESDLLFALTKNVNRSVGPVNLQFKHIMSKLVINLVEGPNFEGEIPDDVVANVYSTATSGIVDWTSGSIAKDPYGEKKSIKMKKVSNTQFEAVLIPQNIEKRTPLIDITMGGISYLLEYSVSFRAGYKHTINVTLNTSPDQEQIEIDIDPTVDTW